MTVLNQNQLDTESASFRDIFEEHVLSTDNKELLESDESARLLDKATLKKALKRRKEIQSELRRARYEELKREYVYLRDEFQETKAVLHTTLLENKQSEHLRARLKRLQRRGLELKQALDELKPMLRQLHRIEARLQEHQTAARNEALLKSLESDMKKYMLHFATILSKEWSRLGYNEEIHLPGRVGKPGKKKVRRVKFEHCVVTADEIQYKIKVSHVGLFGGTIHHLPAKVSVNDLIKPETLANLEMACQRPISTPHTAPELGGDGFDYSHGAWIVVHRLDMSGGLFEYISHDQIMAKYNLANRDHFPVPVGVKRGRKIVYCRLDEHPHIFIDGQTGTGKSNAINVFLSTLIRMHTPDEIRFVLVDLKRGGDLNAYAHAPHVIPYPTGDKIPNVIKSVPQLKEVMELLTKLHAERMSRISDVAADIKRYNAAVSEEHRLPRIVVIIDEYAAIALDSDHKFKIDNAVKLLSTQSRASGIHLMLGSQQPYADIIPKLVRGNITFKLGGRQMTMGASMSSFGSGAATRVKKIPGRMVCNNGREEFQVQVGHATDDFIAESVAIAGAHPAPRNDVWLGLYAPPDEDTQEYEPIRVEQPIIVQSPARPVVTPELYARIAIEHCDGSLAFRGIQKHVERHEGRGIQRLQEIRREIVALGKMEIDGITYEIVERGTTAYLEKQEQETVGDQSDNEQTEEKT